MNTTSGGHGGGPQFKHLDSSVASTLFPQPLNRQVQQAAAVFNSNIDILAITGVPITEVAQTPGSGATRANNRNAKAGAITLGTPTKKGPDLILSNTISNIVAVNSSLFNKQHINSSSNVISTRVLSAEKIRHNNDNQS